MNIAKAILPLLFLSAAAQAEAPRVGLDVRVPYAHGDLSSQVDRNGGGLINPFDLAGRRYGLGVDLQLWVSLAPSHRLRPRLGADAYADLEGASFTSAGQDSTVTRSRLETGSRHLGVDYVYEPAAWRGLYLGAGLERRQWRRAYQVRQQHYTLVSQSLVLVSDASTRAEGSAWSWTPGVLVGWAPGKVNMELAYRSGRVDMPVPAATAGGEAALAPSSLRASTVELSFGWRF
jgi:hypothetical protein